MILTWLFVVGMVVLSSAQTTTPRPSNLMCAGIDLAFLLDDSGSIRYNNNSGPNWDIMKNFTISLVNTLQIGLTSTRVAAVTFSNAGVVQFNFSQSTSASVVVDKLQNLPYTGGNTNTSGGEYMLLTQIFQQQYGDRPNVNDVAVIITDGQSTRDTAYTIPYAHELKARGIKIVAIGITDSVNMAELDAIASIPADVGGFQTVFMIQNFTQLSDIVNKLTTCFPTVPVCRRNADVVVMLDSSGNIGADRFQNMKNWTSNFIGNLDLDGHTAQIGLMTFSDVPTTVFNLGDFSQRSGAAAAVSLAQYAGRSTNTAEAFRVAREQMFNSSAGARPNFKNVIVLVTASTPSSVQQAMYQAQLCKDTGIHIIVVALGSWFSDSALNSLASYPYAVNRLTATYIDLLNQNLSNYVWQLACDIQVECGGPCPNSVRCVEEVGMNWCACFDGYAGLKCNESCKTLADVVFALDASSSIGPDNFELMVDFVGSVVEGVKVGNIDGLTFGQIGMLTFADNVSVEFNLNKYRSRYDVLNHNPYYQMGSTNTAEALRVIREVMFTAANGDQPNVRNIAIVITDGYSNNETNTWQQARLCREAGIQIIAIGIGQAIRLRELQAIASYPNLDDQNVRIIKNFNDMPVLRGFVRSSVCQNFNYCANNACLNGATCVEGLNTYECRCPANFTGRYCERACPGLVDLVFIVDVSSALRRERLIDIIQFLQNVTLDLEIGLNKTRVGLVTWSASAYIAFQLNSYSLKQDVMQAFAYAPYIGGRTNTIAALQLTRNSMFNVSGDRQHVPNYVIIITNENDNMDDEDTIYEAILLKNMGVYVITVSVGDLVDWDAIRGMASDPDDVNMFQVNRFAQLPNIANLIPAAICNSVNDCQPNPCNTGTCLDALNHYTCNCPVSKGGYNCTSSCQKSMDIAFLLDLSGSTQDEYDNTVTFTRRVIQGLNFQFDLARVAVVTYGDVANIQFYLNSYSTQQEVINALRFVPDAGQTNTQAAINAMQNQVFRVTVGDRAGVPNIGILITDGESNVASSNTIPAATAAKAAGTSMYVVAMGDAMDMVEINGIAGIAGSSDKTDYVFKVGKPANANAVADQLVDALVQDFC